MLTTRMLSMLSCPTCQEDARLERRLDATSGTEELVCSACALVYPVRDGVPALFPHGVMGSDAWNVWRAHLDKLQSRRTDRMRRPRRTVTRWSRASRPQERFARFTGIHSGTLLDIGCGPGKFRFRFEDGHVDYYGLDPIPLPDAAAFPLAQGVAEYIPFRSGVFTDVCVLAALDHFRDLDRAFAEVARVLARGGRFHILQSVHDVRGPVSLVRVAGHRIKDALEEPRTDSDVPKHLAEFSTSSLYRLLADRFEVLTTAQYNGRWYAPTHLMLTVTPKHGSSRSSRHSSRVATEPALETPSRTSD